MKLNEEADKLAKQQLHKVPYTDFLPAINKFIYDKWQQRWDTQVNNKLHSIKSTLGNTSYGDLCRKDQVKLSRIRIGHTRLTHSFLMEGLPKPVCAECNNVELTVQHLMLDCNKYTRFRYEYLGFLVGNMRDFFRHSNKDIIAFIKGAGLYNLL